LCNIAVFLNLISNEITPCKEDKELLVLIIY
jgi:hypothetical protein